MAVVIGSERNIKVTAEDNSTKSQGPAFHCSPAGKLSTFFSLSPSVLTFPILFIFFFLLSQHSQTFLFLLLSQHVHSFFSLSPSL
jgi:hypothetical protein